jgi:hypothetical protein
MKIDVHPSVAMVQKWMAELPAKSGKSLDQWAAAIRKAKIAKIADARAWLKEQGIGGNTASFIAQYTLDRATWDGDPESYLKAAGEFVAGMYAGPKESLKPILLKLVSEARKFGKDVLVCPCKTMVPLYRNRVFAEIKPTTRTRIDLSLALDKEMPESGVLKRNEQRLKKGDRLTHIIALVSEKDVNAEVLKWLRAAYERDG